jgi:hypothetical protein
MPQSNAERYREFVITQIGVAGSFDFDPETVVWHYTSGAGLLGIIGSGTLYSTQVSCLSDSTEIRYASALLKNALTELLSTYGGTDAVRQFIARYIKLLEGEPEMPSHAPSPFFVTCFTREEDSLPHWMSNCHGENGYAIGFKAGNLLDAAHSGVVKVNYDKTVHERLASTVAEITVKFYEEGLENKSPEEVKRWDDEFLVQWDTAISYLAPLAKDPSFSTENEYRIIHEFNVDDLRNTVILQKKTMMTRHVPVFLPRGGEAWVPRLPIEKVIVGPCRHREISRISVDTLLRKMGYGTGKVVASVRPFQET